MRLTKKIGNTNYTYLYKNGLLVQETRGDEIFDYSYDANGSIRMLKHRATESATPTYYYYALNSRSDVVGLYNSSGAVCAKYTYDPWGNITSVTNASGTAITDTNNIAHTQPFRYRSYYYDTDSKFYYLQSRYYDPLTHRFINADGLVSTGTGVLGFNMFAYCDNNPVNMEDYTGLCHGYANDLNLTSPYSGVRYGYNCGSYGIHARRPKSSTGSAKPYKQVSGNDNKNSPNCYAYAIGSPKNEQPGGTSGLIPTNWNDVYDVGDSVTADLRAKGYTVRTISGANTKVYHNEFKIALRVGTQPYAWDVNGEPYYDYHFMRQTDTGQWAEKHGIGGDSVLWPVGMTPDTIPWTLGGFPYYDSPIIYYAIGR